MTALELGLTDNDFNFLMALTAILFFTVVYYALVNFFTR